MLMTGIKRAVETPEKSPGLRENAACIAALMLTTEVLVADSKEGGPKAAAVGAGLGGTY